MDDCATTTLMVVQGDSIVYGFGVLFFLLSVAMFVAFFRHFNSSRS